MVFPELLDLLNEAVIVRTKGGEILHWNRVAAELYGYTVQEAAGKNVDELLKRITTVSCSGGLWEGEIDLTTRGGKTLRAFCKAQADGQDRVVEVHSRIPDRTGTDLRLVIDNLPGLVSYIDRNLRYRFVNRAYCEWFSLSEGQIVGAYVPDVLGEEAFAGVREQMERALAGELVRFDAHLRYTRGGSKYVSVSYVPDRDPQTELIRGFVVLVQDNTARHEAERSLRASESKYRQIVETAHEGIWIIGPDAHTVFANPRMAELLLTTLEQLSQQYSFDYVYEEDIEAAARLFEQKMHGDREPFDFRLKRADGSPMWARISGVPITDEAGNVTGLLGMFTDVTQSRAVEQALRESEEHFRTLLASLPDVISRFDRERRFMYVSPAVEHATGLPPEAFIGKTHSQAGVPEPIASELSERLGKIIASAEPLHVDFAMPAPDGTLRKYHGLGVPEMGQDGLVKTVLTIVHDVTEQQAAAEALRASNAELERFAYAAAHDLQEPLRVIGAYTHLLVRKVGSDADPRAREAADFISKGVKQMQALIQDLLVYSRIVHEEPYPLVPTPLDAALDQALAGLDYLKGAGAQIDRGSLPTVLGDQGQLAQLFQNVLSNAAKYRRADASLVIRIFAERHDADWVVSVADNGIGFDPSYSERIFGLFKRLHRDEYPGTGVGLGICKRIIERHGGRIWAESAGSGKGATFRFTLRTST